MFRSIYGPRHTCLRLALAIIFCMFSLFGLPRFSRADLPPLSLADASRRTLEHHPSLHIFTSRFASLKAAQTSADLPPEYTLSLEAENILGSGAYSGTDAAELTVSLASVIELGGKRAARVGAARSQLELAEAERKIAALDLLGQVTQTFIGVLSQQEKVKVAEQTRRMARQHLQLVQNRVEQGAAPDAERLRAEVYLTQATLQEQAMNGELASRQFALATLWRAEEVDFAHVSGDLFRLAEAPSFAMLYARVQQSPALDLYIYEERLRAADLALARSQSTANIAWTLGARHFADTQDSALLAGISLLLGTRARNRSEIERAIAAQDTVAAARDATLLNLRARLFEAWQTHQHSAAAAHQLRTSVLPTLKLALAQTRQAYERGRYGYAEWMAAERDYLDARLAAIDAATTALLNQALIEQLTAEPLTEPRP